MFKVLKPLSGKIIITNFVLIFVLLGICKANAQITPATPGIQAIMFSKIFTYVRTIGDSGKYEVLVVYDDASGYPDEIIKAFKNEGITTKVASIKELETVEYIPQVLYMPEGLKKESISAIINLPDKLFITGDPDYIFAGNATLSVGLENERIKILINLKVLEGKHHQVSSELINLARVIE